MLKTEFLSEGKVYRDITPFQAEGPAQNFAKEEEKKKGEEERKKSEERKKQRKRKKSE